MEMHWILTLEMPSRGSLTAYGVFTPGPGETRSQVFTGVRDGVIQKHPELASANTVFWSLEPNQL